MKKKRMISLFVLLMLIIGCFGNSSDIQAAPKPIIKNASLVAATTVSIRWSKIRNASNYEIYYSQDGEGYVKLKSVKNNYCVIKNLELGTKYTYKVRAILRGKKGAFSRPKTIITKNSAYLLDIRKPYSKPYDYKEESFSVAGKIIKHGFTIPGYNLSINSDDNMIARCGVCFNLQGKYSKISFECGYIPNSSGSEEGNIKVFLDDSEADTSIVMKPNDLSEEYTVDVSYCNKLTLIVDVDAGIFGMSSKYGIGNIKVYK